MVKRSENVKQYIQTIDRSGKQESFFNDVLNCLNKIFSQYGLLPVLYGEINTEKENKPESIFTVIMRETKRKFSVIKFYEYCKTNVKYYRTIIRAVAHYFFLNGNYKKFLELENEAYNLLSFSSPSIHYLCSTAVDYYCGIERVQVALCYAYASKVYNWKRSNLIINIYFQQFFRYGGYEENISIEKIEGISNNPELLKMHNCVIKNYTGIVYQSPICNGNFPFQSSEVIGFEKMQFPTLQKIISNAAQGNYTYSISIFFNNYNSEKDDLKKLLKTFLINKYKYGNHYKNLNTDIRGIRIILNNVYGNDSFTEELNELPEKCQIAWLASLI